MLDGISDDVASREAQLTRWVFAKDLFAEPAVSLRVDQPVLRDALGGMFTARDGVGKRWRARHVDDHGGEHSKAFTRRVDAQRWLDNQTTLVVAGRHVTRCDARLTVDQWCGMWIEGYKVNRESSVRQARTHISQIVTEFGGSQLSAIRPSSKRGWPACRPQTWRQLWLRAALAAVADLADALHDGLLSRNPCSRRTAPPMGKQKVYVATTEQVCAINDAMPEHFRPAVLLGAFAGLRVVEVSALKLTDVDFIRGVEHPKQQWPDKPLKLRAATPRSRFRAIWRCCWRSRRFRRGCGTHRRAPRSTLRALMA